MELSARKVILILVFTVGSVLFRNYLMGCECRDDVRLDGKVAIVTGANTGIGKETALDLARRGARVIMACRSLERAEKAAADIRSRVGSNIDLSVMKIDLSSQASIRAFAAEFQKRESKLDILVNNAAVVPNERQETEDGLEMQFAVNHLGYFLLTHLLLDHIKAATPSRIINVSSAAHVFATMDFDDLMSKQSYQFINVYSKTKLANMLFTLELSKRLEGTGVTVNTLHPGTVWTEIGREFPILSHDVVQFLMRPLFWFFLKDATHGAQTTITCAVSPSLQNVTGKYFCDCKIIEPSKEAKNEEDAKRLWDISEKLVKISA